jgi:DNA modification methylase
MFLSELEGKHKPLWKTTRDVKSGDIWACGGNRVGCLDSTDKAQITPLFDGRKAVLVHSDGPYNMKKGDVTGDRQGHTEFDEFQNKWWGVARQNITDNASAYVWGKPEYLWRWWYVGGLKDSERLTFVNDIIWDKPAGGAGGINLKGMKTLRSYPSYKETCFSLCWVSKKRVQMQIIIG